MILGCHSLEEAKAVYLRNYEPGWRIGKVTPLTWPQFKRWAFNGDSSRSMWETDSVELPQKQAAAPYYDWDGTLIPRINGPAGAYLKALAELAKLTPTGRR